MAIKENVNGTWTPISKSWERIDGVYVKHKAVWEKVNGAWVKLWANQYSVVTDWQLVNNGQITTLNIPQEATKLVSAKIRWKGVYISKIFEESIQVSNSSYTGGGEVFELTTSSLNFPNTPNGEPITKKIISANHTIDQGDLVLTIFADGVNVGQITSDYNGNDLINYSISKQVNINTVRCSAKLHEKYFSRYINRGSLIVRATTYYNVAREENTTNPKVVIGGNQTSLTVVLQDGEVSEDVLLLGLQLGSNSIIHSIEGSEQAYYQIEYTYEC